MSGHRPWKDIRGDVDRDPLRQKWVEEARREAEAEEDVYERTLAEVRRARAYTQEKLAALLNVPQSQVSRIERQADLYVSTLARYIEAMGGHLELNGVFDGRRVPLTLADLAPPSDQMGVG